MNNALTDNKTLSLFSRGCWILFFFSFISSFRVATSICTGLLLFNSLFDNRNTLKGFFLRISRDPFFIGCLSFYLLQLAALLYTDNMHAGWGNIRLKSGLLFIPLALCGITPLNSQVRKELSSYFCIILAGASSFCLVIATIRYQQWHYSTIFFYHALVKPLSQHAVYFSIFVFAALVFLLEQLKKNFFLLHKVFHISLVIFFSIFLFLLSSKLVLAFYAVYLVYYFTSLLKRNTANRLPVLVVFMLIIVAGIITITTKNPVSERYYDILHGDMSLINHNKFDRGDYFNGVQFRALQWRFTPEILRNTHSWLWGVSPGDAQFYLDQEYITKNMFVGDPVTGSHGFLGYNTHNQFLQSLLQTGIIGLLSFLFISFCLLRMAWLSRDINHIFLVLLLVAYSLSESVFQTQYGILLYTFFPLFTWPGRYRKDKSA